MCKRSLCCHEISELQKLQLLFYKGYVVVGILVQLLPETEEIDSELLESLKAMVYRLNELINQQSQDDLSYLKDYAPQTD